MRALKKFFLIAFFATLTTQVFADDTDRSAEYILNRVFDGTSALNTSGGSASLEGEVTTIDNVTDGGVLYNNAGVLSTDVGLVWNDGTEEKQLTFGGATGSAISGDAGKIILSSIGNSNNENLIIDLETTSNQPTFSSNTGATSLRTALSWFMLDNTQTIYGTAADVGIEWDTAEGNDSWKFATSVGTAAQSGNIIFSELADINTNFAVPIVQDVTTVWQGSDATQVTERGRIQYNSTLNQFLVSADSGALVLGSTSGIVSIDAGAVGEAQLNLFGASGGCLMFRDRDNAGYTEVSFLDGTIQSTTDADGVCDGS